MNDLRPLGLLLLACLAACSPAASSTPPLAGAAIGGPFTLTDENGGRFVSSQLGGKYRLLYFGYTFCPDICPVDLQQIGQALRQIEKSDPALAAKIELLFITTDPGRDTPAVMKEYTAAFHPRLIGLTGTADEIAKVTRAHGAYGMKREVAGASGYLVDHSRIAMLFGPKGEPIVILPHEEGAAAISAELKKWVA